MQVQLLRRDSRGIQGTYANAEHHAQKCIPLISSLERRIKECGFKTHVQGHNVHLFETTDGRKFDMIPYHDGEEYVGIEIRLRKSRSNAERLTTITKVTEVPELIIMLKMLARPLPDNYRGKFKHELN